MDNFVVNNDHLSYSTLGNPNNFPIIFIHGWSSFKGVWHDVMELLCADYYCVAIDLLGHGNSDIAVKGDYSIEAQARRVIALADHLHLDQFILMGHSMGGKIALYIVAELAPGRVVKLINVAGTVTRKLAPVAECVSVPAVRVMFYCPWIVPLVRPWFRFRSIVKLAIGWWFYNFEKIRPFYWQESVQYAYQPGMHISLYGALVQGLHLLDLTPILPQISCPTLILFGKYDHVVPVSDGELAHRSITNSQLFVFDACGHFPFADQPTRFFAAVKEFLA